MPVIQVDVDDELAALLHGLNQPVGAAARELIILELYRRGSLSSGKAAQLLGMQRADFIQHTSRLGIAYLDMTEDEWDTERSVSDQL